MIYWLLYCTVMVVFIRVEIYPDGHPLDFGDSFRTLVLNASECSTSAQLLSHVRSLLSTHSTFKLQARAPASDPSANPSASRPLPASAWASLVQALEHWHSVSNGSLAASTLQVANSGEQPRPLRSPTALGPSDLRPSPRPHRFAAALVVQTHKRVQFMRHLLDSLAQVSHVQTAPHLPAESPPCFSLVPCVYFLYCRSGRRVSAQCLFSEWNRIPFLHIQTNLHTRSN